MGMGQRRSAVRGRGGRRGVDAPWRRGELWKSPFDPIAILCGLPDTGSSSCRFTSSSPSLSSFRLQTPPHTVLAVFEYELFYGGTLNINIYKGRACGRFPVVPVGRPRLVSSPGSSAQPCGGGTSPRGRGSLEGEWPLPPVSGLSSEQGLPWPAGGLCSAVVWESLLCGNPLSVPLVSKPGRVTYFDKYCFRSF